MLAQDKTAYVFFNNKFMVEDGLLFKKIIES